MPQTQRRSVNEGNPAEPLVQWTGGMSRGEAECGRILRSLFPGKHWENRHRPDWLLNVYPGGPNPPRRLELDWYSEEIGLAVEFNGEQHYRVVPAFHWTGEAGERKLYGQRMRDAKKIELCRHRGINLVIVRFDCPDIASFLASHPAIAKADRK